MVIDDEGNNFVTSVEFVLGLINGKAKAGFISCARLPIKTAPGRYKPSKLWDPNGIANENTEKSQSVTTSDDGLSVKFKDKQKQKQNYGNKEISW